MSYATLEKYGLEENDAVEISVGGRKIVAGALAVPGQSDGVVVVTLGQGRADWARGRRAWATTAI